MSRKISILGSTGSVGQQTLEVAHDIGIQSIGLTTNKNINLLEMQIKKYKPLCVAVMDPDLAKLMQDRVKDVEVYSGIEGLIKVATLSEIDTMVNALVGAIGIRPTLCAIKAKKNIALANKESLVIAGELIMQELINNGVSIYPVDSEHSAIFQCIRGYDEYSKVVSKVILTASGGPFRDKALEDLKHVTVSDALEHPNWNMGKKITIDSATMMNKGLELIEAKWLFNLDVSQLESVIHRESIVHSMVEFIDSSVVAQLSAPDMLLPIAYAIDYPHRHYNEYNRLDFRKISLNFEPINIVNFPCFKLANIALNEGGALPTILNAANEIAVDRFLKEDIDYLEIPQLIERAMYKYGNRSIHYLEDILEADKWARNYVAWLDV